MGLNETLNGTPPTYGIGVTNSMRPPMFNFARQLGQYLSSLIGQPMPEYPGQLDPGMSPTMQMLGKMTQQYSQQGAPPIMGASANTLNRFMNPSFTNPVARIGGGAPGYAPVNPNQTMWGGGNAGSLYNQWQNPSYQLPMAPHGQGGYPQGGGGELPMALLQGQGGYPQGGGGDQYSMPPGGGQQSFDPNQMFLNGGKSSSSVGIPEMGPGGGQWDFTNGPNPGTTPPPWYQAYLNSMNKGGSMGSGGGYGGMFPGGNMGTDPNYFPQGGQAPYSPTGYSSPMRGVPYGGGGGGGMGGTGGGGGMGGMRQPTYLGKPAPAPQGGNGWMGTSNPGAPSNPSNYWTQQMLNSATPMGKSPGGNYGW